MASNEGYVQWTGVTADEVTYLGQPLTISAELEPGDPIGTLRIKHAAHIGLGVELPNSTNASPVWTAIPGTLPELQVRQDGNYPIGLMQIRSAATLVTFDTTGEMTLPDSLLHMARAIATDIGSPLIDLLFATNASASDPNLLEVAINNDPTQIVTWLNESGRYRAEQRAPLGFDHLITLVASFASASGHLIEFERRDGANARVQMGAINQDGRVMTTLYPFTAITNIDPNITGKYTAQVAALVELPGVRRETDDGVRIRGRIAVTAAGPTAGDVIMVVPAGFAPTNQQWLSVTTTTGIAVPCEIMTSGNVVSRRTQAGATNLCFENFIYKTS
jgi:hypothetical protein